MSDAQQNFSRMGFFKSFVLPALWIFAIPVIGLAFFLHAQSRFDADMREGFLQRIRQDQQATPEQKAEAERFFSSVPFSRLLRNPEFAKDVDPTLKFYYATFRWMIWLSVMAIAGGIGAFLITGLCVLLSLRSQQTQYLSLLIGWNLLRIYCALQMIAVAALLIGLSFWVTALWFEVYYVKLIVIAGLVAGLGVLVVIMAIFKNPKEQFHVEGVVLNRNEELPLWQELQAICNKVGTAPPDQIIAGIDDNFFVTEQPVTVDGKTLQGKTLFVSLPLLKQLHGAEASAVLAHEMAHFSGNDTVFAKRIAPLLSRYQAYLQSLYEGGITLPAFYLMFCFRALFELSLTRLSRQREFRADKIAAETTSPRDCAGALLRIAAYSRFRNSVQQELFEQEQALETADVSSRIERGFSAYAVAFASDPALATLATSHPFDTHPPMAQRMSALGVDLEPAVARDLLAESGDGQWHHHIPEASELEQKQWQVYEERFREYHAASLPYRFLPETPEEIAVVEKAFPEVSFTGKEGKVTFDYLKMQFEPWADPLLYSEITKCELSDEGVLTIQTNRKGERSRTIKTKKFETQDAQQLLGAFQNYFGRYQAAVEYQKQVQAKQASQPEAEAENSATQE